MNAEEVVDSLQAEDHFYVSCDPKIFRSDIPELSDSSIKELLCVFNGLKEHERFLIFVPKPFGDKCHLGYSKWIDQTLPRQWNHLWIPRAQLVRIFLRKSSI